MKLGLSSAVMPAAAVDDQLVACAARGLDALELTLAEALLERERLLRGVSTTPGDAVRVAGVLAERCDDVHTLASLSRDFGAPVVLAGPSAISARLECGSRVRAAGGDALVLVSGPAAGWADVLAVPGIRLGWQIDGTSADPASDAALLVEAGVLEYVRLLGGGPESVEQEGRGIGAVMKRLALAAYGGPLIMAPSSTRYRVAWSTWLRGRASCGCSGSPHGSLPVLAGDQH